MPTPLLDSPLAYPEGEGDEYGRIEEGMLDRFGRNLMEASLTESL